MNPGTVSVIFAAKHGGCVNAVRVIPVIEVGEGVEVLLVAVEGRLAGRGWREIGARVSGLEHECFIHGGGAGAVLALQTGGVAGQIGGTLDAGKNGAGGVVAVQGGGVEGRKEGALHGNLECGVGGLCDGEGG